MNLRRVSLALIVALALAAGMVSASSPARNLIIFIVDGMGPSHVQLAQLSSKETLAMTGMPVTGLMGTLNVDRAITDSAASATAMFCGSKTYNGLLGSDSNLNELESIMDIAQRKGFLTGIITNSALYDATSAAMYAKEFDRLAYRSISTKLLASGIDLLIGGGSSYLRPQLDGLAKSAGSGLKWNVSYGIKGLRASKLPAMCILAEDALPYSMEMPDIFPSLAEMVTAGLSKLTSEGKPFILLVESGAVDRMSHDNDAAGTLSEMLYTDKAVKACLDFAAKDGRTLVVVTADHETGGLSLGSGSGYTVGVKYLQSIRKTADTIMKEAMADWNRLQYIMEKDASWRKDIDRSIEHIPASKDPAREIGIVISSKANITWGSGWHTAAPVTVGAEGPGSHLFSGWYENAELFTKFRGALGL